MLRSGYRPLVRRHWKVTCKKRCKEAWGLALITVTLVALIVVGSSGSLHNKPIQPTVNKIQYEQWAAQVGPLVGKLAAAKLDTPTECQAALSSVWSLESGPVSPVAPSAWTSWLGDSERALTSCGKGDVSSMMGSVTAMQGDEATWVAAVKARYPDLMP